MLKLFDLSFTIFGFPLREAKAELQNSIKLSDQGFANFISNKKKEILAYHLKNNAFYKKCIGSVENLNWEDIPVLNKRNFQIPLRERLSNEYSLKKVYINKTSGSSGDPFIFAKDKFCHALTWASNIYRFNWYGIDFNTSYQARFYGIPLSFWSKRKELLKDFLSNRHRFCIFDLSDEVLESFLIEFRKRKFDYINGYTSAIVLFAKFLKSKNIVLNTICPSLKVCVVTSEMLFEEDKKLLEIQFGIPIINEYGASELDLIAFENPQGEWQVNSETLYVEILDKNNNVLPYGKEGRIVITSFYNKAHPFIRYDIGDIGVLDEKSTLKKPILKSLLGRTNDIAVLPSGKKSPGLTFYYVTKSIIEDDGNVKEFIIKQNRIDSFEVEYVSKFELNPSQIKKIDNAIALYLEPNLKFSFIRKTNLDRTNRGKLKQFTAMVN